MPPKNRLDADIPDGDVPSTRLWMRPVNPATLSSNERMMFNNMEVMSAQLSVITDILVGGHTLRSTSEDSPRYTGKPLATFVEDLYPVFRDFVSDAPDNKPLVTRSKSITDATTRFRDYLKSHDFATTVSNYDENHDLNIALHHAPETDFVAMYITLSKRFKDDQKPKNAKRKSKGDTTDGEPTGKIEQKRKDDDNELMKKRRRIILDSDDEI